VRILEPSDRGQQPPIQRALEGRQFVQPSFRGWAQPGSLILLLKRTLGNIMYILEPWDKRLAAPIHRYSRGSQFFVVEFSGVGNVWLVRIIVETHSREYNVYFRAMRQRLTAPDPEGA